MPCEPLNISTTPSPRVEQQHCSCGELLTLEMEFDTGVCVDCLADLAQLHPATSERIPA